MIGKDKGKQAKVVSVDSKLGKVLVDGVNMVKKHQRPKKQGEKGEIVTVSRPVNASNAMLVCSSCSKPARVGFKKEGNKKVRYCKKCNANN